MENGSPLYFNRKFVRNCLLLGLFLLALGLTPLFIQDGSLKDGETSPDDLLFVEAVLIPMGLFLCAFYGKEYFFPEPFMIISAEGLESGWKPFRWKLAWREIKALQAFTSTYENVRMRFLGVVLLDPEAVTEKLGAMQKFAALASEALGSPAFCIPLDNLSVNEEELVARIRAHFKGPVNLNAMYDVFEGSLGKAH